MSLDTAYAAETRVPGILLGLILPTILAAPFILGRLSTRAIITRNWGTDDTIICISWILSIAGVILGSLLTKYGFGHHTIFMKVSWIAPEGKLAFLGAILFQTVVCFTKLGMCLSYLRIFEDRRSRVLLLSIMAFLVASGITTVCMIVFRCSPISAQWTPQLGGCKQTGPNIVTSAVCNIAADIMLMAFAIPRVLALQLPLKPKVILLVVASLGVLVIAASIARCESYIIIQSNADPSWNGMDGSTWGVVEMETGLFCACAPCIRPLIRKIAPRLLSSSPESAAVDFSTARSNNISGTRSSRPRFPSHYGVFELQSEPHVGLPGKRPTSQGIWDGTGESRISTHVETNNDGKVEVISESSTSIDGILKTVTITGSETLADDRDSIKKFEHV